MIIAGLIILSAVNLAFYIGWMAQVYEIAREADEERADEIADELLANAEIRVIQRLEIIDEMTK